MKQRVAGDLQGNPERLKQFAFGALLSGAFFAVLLLLWGGHTAVAAPQREGLNVVAPMDTGTPTPTETPTPSPNTSACSCGEDQYEPDDEEFEASWLPAGSSQRHSFHIPADIDWFRFADLRIGWTYIVSTFDLVDDADTLTILYDQIGKIVGTNDDLDGVRCRNELPYCASTITWTAASPGPYFLFVRTLDYAGCGCPKYSIRLDALGSFLPVLMAQATPTFTPTPTYTLTPTHTPGPSPTPTMTPTPPAMDYPQAIAVNSGTHMLYVASRDTNRVYLLDGTSLGTVTSTVVGNQPWGITYFAPRNKVYVGSWSAGTVTVLDGTSLAVVKTIYVGSNPTWVKRAGDQIQLISYGANSLVTIDPVTDTVIRNVHLRRTNGAWALAYNASLNLTYVSSRDSKTITVVDAGGAERTVISTGGSVGCEPYELDFSATVNRLYSVCDIEGQRNDVVIAYQASGVDLAATAEITIGSAGPDVPGGEDGRGGVLVNPNTGSLFVSNSYDNTVSIIDSSTNKVIGTVDVGLNPFGLGVDTTTQRVYSANRASDNVSMFLDPK
jgi:YVTN family beta-propeller protein